MLMMDLVASPVTNGVKELTVSGAAACMREVSRLGY
jgi:hypothetical protein